MKGEGLGTRACPSIASPATPTTIPVIIGSPDVDAGVGAGEGALCQDTALERGLQLVERGARWKGKGRV